MADSGWLQAQRFISSYSAFLKRQGKLPIPGTSSMLSRLPRMCLYFYWDQYESLADLGSALRLGRHSKNLSLKRTTTPINRLVRHPRTSSAPYTPSSRPHNPFGHILTDVYQVLHPRRRRCPPHLPPENCRCRPHAKSPRQHQEPWLKTLSPCRCKWIGGS